MTRLCEEIDMRDSKALAEIRTELAPEVNGVVTRGIQINKRDLQRHVSEKENKTAKENNIIKQFNELAERNKGAIEHEMQWRDEYVFHLAQ